MSSVEDGGGTVPDNSGKGAVSAFISTAVIGVVLDSSGAVAL